MANRLESLSVRALPFALAVLLAGAVPAAAQEQKYEPTALQRFLGNIGLLEIPGDPIPYRERAPLVVPPSNDLVPPRSAGDVAKINPDWPIDPDSERRREEAAESEKKVDEQFYSGRTLGANELRAKHRARRQAAGPQPMTAGEEQALYQERYSPAKLGFKGWNRPNEEPMVFTAEPERRFLTEPPPGYRTPSPNAPYGVVSKGKYVSKAPTLYDRTSDPEDPSQRK
jgi:hypothetical protein